MSSDGGGGAAAKSLRDVRAEVEALLAEGGFTGAAENAIQPLGTAPYAAHTGEAVPFSSNLVYASYLGSLYTSFCRRIDPLKSIA